MARGLSRVLFSAAVGAKTPNSGGTEQHRSTIALAGSLRPKKASVEAHQAAGDQSTSYNLLITSLKCVSVTDRPKTFVRPLTSLLLCCAQTTRVAAFRERQQPELHLGSHIFHLGGFRDLAHLGHSSCQHSCLQLGWPHCLPGTSWQSSSHEAGEKDQNRPTGPRSYSVGAARSSRWWARGWVGRAGDLGALRRPCFFP